MDDTNKTCREFVAALASVSTDARRRRCRRAVRRCRRGPVRHGSQPDHRKKEVRLCGT